MADSVAQAHAGAYPPVALPERIRRNGVQREGARGLGCVDDHGCSGDGGGRGAERAKEQPKEQTRRGRSESAARVWIASRHRGGAAGLLPRNENRLHHGGVCHVFTRWARQTERAAQRVFTVSGWTEVSIFLGTRGEGRYGVPTIQIHETPDRNSEFTRRHLSKTHNANAVLITETWESRRASTHTPSAKRSLRRSPRTCLSLSTSNTVVPEATSPPSML